MNDSKRVLLRYIETIVDVIVIVVSYFLANKIKFGRFRSGILNPEEPYVALLVIILVAYALVTILIPNKYTLIERNLLSEIYTVAKLHLYMLAFTLGYLYFTKTSSLYSREQIIIFVILSLVLMVALRQILKRLITKEFHRSGANEKIMLVTTSERVEEVVAQIKKTRNWYFRISNIVLLDKDMVGKEIDGIEVIGTRQNLVNLVETSEIDSILLHLPADYDFSREKLVQTACDMGKYVHVNIEEYDVDAEIKELKFLSNYAVVTYRGIHHRIRYRVVKRSFDIVVGILGTILLIPVYLLVSVGHVLEGDRKHSIISVVRVGKNGRRFYMYKFRTMYSEKQRRGADNKCSTTGRIIKLLGLEYLPTMWNVLWGDMSIVGPKPPSLPEFIGYPRKRRKTLYVKPGLVGYWQVNRKGTSDYNEESIAEMDQYYVDNWSLGLDTQIMMKSITLLFAKRKGN